MARPSPSRLSRAVSLLSPQARNILARPLRLSGHSLPTSTTEEADYVTSDVSVEEPGGVVSACLSCHVTFEDRAEQVAHYRLDWHRYNLKRRLRGLTHVTQAVFEAESGDLSSISGSESDCDDSNSEESLEKTTPTDHTHHSSSPFIYFTSGDSKSLYSVYRVILTGGKEYSSATSLLPALLSLSHHPPLWIVLMRAGGHFAGAVFSGCDVLVHKTFHRYTVRAKRGTAQSVRDSLSGGHGPKSAGASLRRYNEVALEREVHQLLVSWSEHIQGASVIFIRSPKNHQSMFTGGRNPPLSKEDPRIRGIPLPTRRPTFKEVKRVHTCLASVYVVNSTLMSVDMAMEPVAKVTETHSVPTAASIKEVRGEEGSVSGDNGDSSDGDDSGGVMGERGGEVNDEVKKRKKAKKKKGKAEKSWKELSLSPALVRLLRVCEKGGRGEEGGEEGFLRDLGLWPRFPLSDTAQGDVGQHTAHTSSSGHAHSSSHIDSSGQETVQPVTSSESDVLNVLYGGRSPLHVASEHGHAEVVGTLLHYGADPTVKDSSGRVPYVVAKEKSVRDSYRRFMGRQPHAWDYVVAQVPSPLTEDMERQRREKAALKKKEQKRHAKKKQAQEKSQREEEVVVRRQGAAVEGLSDREKRALAAEKRLALKNINDSSIQRAGVCSCCGRGLAGMVPFHRLQYQYCSMACVREHRTQLEAQC